MEIVIRVSIEVPNQVAYQSWNASEGQAADQELSEHEQESAQIALSEHIRESIADHLIARFAGEGIIVDTELE